MLEEIIAGGASALGICLPEGAAEQYRRYYRRLIEANESFNLTAIEGEDAAARLHFLDSIAVLRYADIAGARVIDVGTGGGLPGLALKIARPAADMTLLDATEKKVAFLEGLTQELGLPCRCVAARGEELSHSPEYRESFDIAVARAVAQLRVLAELCLPFVKVGGRFLALKSADTDGEIDSARQTVEALGGKITAVNAYTIPGTEIPRRVITIEKTSPTPAKYPRRWAAMQKRGL